MIRPPAPLAGITAIGCAALLMAAAAPLAAAAADGITTAPASAPAPAAATAIGPVVLLGTAEDEPLTGRIAAELGALGIPIEVRVVAGEERGIDLEVAIALREGARAAIRIDAQLGRTEVSIADPVTHKVALKQVLEGEPTAALAPLLAVRTVEFVRATLLGPRNAPDADAASAVAKAAAENHHPDVSVAPTGKPPAAMHGLGVAIDSGVLATPGGLRTGATVGLIARVRLFRRIGIELMGFTPLTSDRMGGIQGSSRASVWLGGAGLFARQPVGERIGIEVGAGAMAALLQASGVVAVGNTNDVGGTDWATGASVYARLGADVALSRVLALRADLLAGGAFRQADVIIDGASHAAWSRSFAAALGGVEARWF